MEKPVHAQKGVFLWCAEACVALREAHYPEIHKH